MTTRQLIMAAATNVSPGSSGGGGDGGGAPIDPSKWLIYFADDAATDNLCHGIDTNGNTYMAGWHQDVITNDWGTYVIKINTLGEFQWFMLIPEIVTTLTGIPGSFGTYALPAGTYRSFEPCAITSNREGTAVYITGYSEDDSNWFNTIVALDPATGSILWQSSFGYDWGIGDVIEGGYPHAIKTDSQGNVYVVGWTEVANYDRAYIAKLNSVGSVLYVKLFSHTGDYYLEFYDIQVLESKNALLVCGQTYTTRDCGYLAMYDLTGELIWQTDGIVFNGDPTYFYALVTDVDGNIYVGVEYYNNYGYSAAGVIKFDSSGVMIWQKGFYNTEHGLRYPNIIIDLIGNILLTASADSNSYGSLFAYLLPDGSVSWTQYLRNLYNGQWGSTHLAIDRSGNIYTGHTWRNIENYYMSFATKRSSDPIPAGSYIVGSETLVVVDNIALEADDPVVTVQDPNMASPPGVIWAGPGNLEIRTEPLLTFEKLALA